MTPIYRRMIIMWRIFKNIKAKSNRTVRKIIISYFASIHLIRFFSIEKEEYLFHMGSKTEEIEFECFIWNVSLRHYINEYIRIINRNNLNETFHAHKELFDSYKKRKFFSCDCDYLDSTEY